MEEEEQRIQAHDKFGDSSILDSQGKQRMIAYFSSRGMLRFTTSLIYKATRDGDEGP